MKYSATLNGKQYEVELERVEEYAPIPRGGVAAAAPTAPIAAPAVKAAPATPAAAPSPADSGKMLSQAEIDALIASMGN